MEKREQLLTAIAAQERLRGTLDDQIIEATITALQNQLDEIDRSPQQQRKLITILFMDIVGSSQIGLHLDPEDTMDIMDGALKFIGEAVPKYGGRITRYMGDGFKAVFGAQVAQENDPEMAVRSGLEILKLAQDYAIRLEQEWGIKNFQVRVGINTGLVALGGMTEAEDTVMGSTVNLAARMESAAPPGNLMISQHTFQHVRGLFEVQPIEPISVKGFDQPVQVYLVCHLKPRAKRKHLRGVEGVQSKLVGRETELQLLKDAYFTALEEGEGQVLTISGEAGLGKSRLLSEFQEWLAIQPTSWRIFEGQSSLEARHVPYGLLRDLFTSQFHDPQSLDSESNRLNVEHGFTQVFGFDTQGEMRAHIISQLLGYDYSASAHLQGLMEDAQQLRNRAYNYMLEYFAITSRSVPVLIILEDIHWADDSTLDIVDQLGRETPHMPLVIICLARERLFERRPHWGEGQAYHSHIALPPLSIRQSRLLVAEILTRAPDVPSEFRELITAGSEGNPYYIEELIKMLITQGMINTQTDIWQIDASNLDQVEIPPTLLGVLQARLDGLPAEEKVTLQYASVIGRIFWDQALAYMGKNSPDISFDLPEVNQHLTSLRAREMVFRREASEFSNTSEFSFKHSILRDVAYESVLKKNRKELHRQIAGWLQDNKHLGRGEYQGLIADHLEVAGDEQQAIPLLKQAGDLAARHFANEEAIIFYQRAINLLLRAKERPSDTESQLAPLYESLADILSLNGKHQASRTEYQHAIALVSAFEQLTRARLQRKIGSTWQDEGNYEQTEQAFDAAEQFLGEQPFEEDSAKWQEWIWIQLNRLNGYYAQAETGKIVHLLQEVHPAVEKYGSLQQHAAYYSGQARMYFRRDRYTVTPELLDTTCKLLEISQEIGDIQRLSDAHFELGFTLLWYGDLDQAEKQMLNGLDFAQQCSNLYSQTLCNTYLTILYRKRRDFSRTQEYLKDSIETATNRNMINYLATARGNQAWMALHNGELEQAEIYGQQALELWAQVPFVYPFQWTALWPLITIAVEKGDFHKAVIHARGLLAEDQQALPNELTSCLQTLIHDWDREPGKNGRQDFQNALRLAGVYKLI